MSFQHWSSHWQVFLQGPYSVPPSRLAYQLVFASSQGFLVSGHRSREGLVRCGNIWEGKEREASPVNAVHPYLQLYSGWVTIHPQATHLSLVRQKFSFCHLSNLVSSFCLWIVGENRSTRKNLQPPVGKMSKFHRERPQGWNQTQAAVPTAPQGANPGRLGQFLTKISPSLVH